MMLYTHPKLRRKALEKNYLRAKLHASMQLQVSSGMLRGLHIMHPKSATCHDLLVGAERDVIYPSSTHGIVLAQEEDATKNEAQDHISSPGAHRCMH